MINNSKKLLLSSVVASTLLANVANAGAILDFEVGAGSWKATPSGYVDYGTELDLEDKLGLGSSTNTYMYADFNHFIPLVPNLRVETQDLSSDGSKQLNATINNITYNATTKTTVDLKQTDFILYWGVPGINLATAGILDVNFGLDFKKFDGSIAFDAPNTIPVNANLDFMVPMGYVAATVDPPFIPASLSASYKTISYKGSSLNDMMAKVSINLPIPLPLIDIKADIGYKKQSLVIDSELSDNISADIEFTGMFFGVSAKF